MSLLLTAKSAKRFQHYQHLLPRPILRQVLFSSMVKRAVRSDVAAVWRPIVEAALVDQLEIVVEPKSIIGWLPETMDIKGLEVETKWWFVLPGSWENDARPFEDHETYAPMRDLVTAPDLKQSPSYLSLIEQQTGGMAPSRVTKVDGTVDGYFSFYKALAQKMRETSAVPDFGENDKDRHIGVAVGPNGQLYHHQKGHHRVMLSKLLHLSEIRVQVRAVHPQWVAGIMRGSKHSYADAIAIGISRL